ncbi:MAG: glycosyltransferase family 2 protein [Candidatus Curtissbacteria bacterium]|nr:glycosyltransferase family 2 protein [Candidatus Curtissbacteria bacterium]
MVKVDFSLILACYNEGPTFEESVQSIFLVLKLLKINWEIIFVEDKSVDETKRSIEKFVASDKNFKAIYHKKNQGRGKSVSDGIKAADGTICGFIDVDCEISPSYIPLFIEEIENGSDMAIATRYYEISSGSVMRVVASKSYCALVSKIISLPFKDTEAGYKFFNRKKILPVLSKTRDHGWFFDTEICARALVANLKITEIPVLFIKRPDKKSTVRLIPDSIEYMRKLVQFRQKFSQDLR